MNTIDEINFLDPFYATVRHESRQLLEMLDETVFEQGEQFVGFDQLTAISPWLAGGLAQLLAERGSSVLLVNHPSLKAITKSMLGVEALGAVSFIDDGNPKEDFTEEGFIRKCRAADVIIGNFSCENNYGLDSQYLSSEQHEEGAKLLSEGMATLANKANPNARVICFV